jgi:hypothetical protein
MIDLKNNRKNQLKKIVEVQNITLEHTGRGISQAWVYDNVIYPRFFISPRTYYRWLSEPAKRELAELEAKEAG